jgi:hypothetical protein
MRAGKFEFLPNTEYIKIRWENDSGADDVYDFDVPLGEEDEQAVRLEVTVADGDRGFIIPTGNDNDNPREYVWYVDWGDGSPIITNAGGSYSSSASIYAGTAPRHTYPAAGTYTITITPARDLEAWFYPYATQPSGSTADFAAASNIAKLVKFDALLTPEMVRTSAQLAADAAGPSRQFVRLAAYASNLKSMGNTRFSRRWETLTKANQYFCTDAFLNCPALEAMSAALTFPQGFTTVSMYFGSQMFRECKHPNFAMNRVFNLPQKLSALYRALGTGMFRACNGTNFSMNDVFQIPQGAATAEIDTLSSMFQDNWTANFVVNEVFKFPTLPQVELDKSGVFFKTFQASAPPNFGPRSLSSGTIRYPPSASRLS